jgi:hypothetical protein
MGRHFDSLVDLIKKKKLIKDSDTRTYLKDVIDRAALFDFPLLSEELRPKMDMSEPEYVSYMEDFFETSKQYGEFFLMPFETTAIEDPQSVVIMDRKKPDQYIVTICEHSIHTQTQKPIESLQVFSLIFDDPLKNIVSQYEHMFDAAYHGRKDIGVELPYLHLCEVAATGALAFMKTSAYIMDPENFVIRREANHARKKIAKKQQTNKRCLQKTDVRPHYICMGYEPMKDLLENESTDTGFQLVKGHWRRLQSEKFTRMKGQRIFVSQYHRGKGEFTRDRYHYQVYVKPSPTEVVPYSRDICKG